MAVENVIRGRHAYFTDAGVPVVRKLETDSCRDTPVEMPEARHITYKPSGLPIVAKGLLPCCDWHTDARTAMDCFPGGLSTVFGAFVENGANCPPLENGHVVFTGGGGTWTASIDLPNGTLDMTFSCDPSVVSIFDPCKWKINFSGCSIVGEMCSSAIVCTDPLILVWEVDPDTVPVPVGAPGACCGCLDSDSKELILYLGINCKPIVFARHVDYHGGMPVVAISNKCPDQQGQVTVPCCPSQTVPTTLRMVGVSGCCSFDVTLTWTPNHFGSCGFVNGAWVYSGDVCGAAQLIEVYCTGTFPFASWALNMTGCITVLGTVTGVRCDAGEEFTGSGTGVFVTCGGDCGGGMGTMDFAITEVGP